MNNADYDYEYEDIVEAIKKAGIQKNDVLFSYSNIGFFGKMHDAKSMDDYCSRFKKAIFEVIGKDGTLVVPTFSYSFCNNKSLLNLAPFGPANVSISSLLIISAHGVFGGAGEDTKSWDTMISRT